MTTPSLDAHTIIHQMIQLRLQLEHTKGQIRTLQADFHQACEALNTDPIKLAHATLSRRLTKGVWTYPQHILEAERHLKQLKKDFQDAHEPTTGREFTWAIRLLNIESC